jgi:hypothetical protein
VRSFRTGIRPHLCEGGAVVVIVEDPKYKIAEIEKRVQLLAAEIEKCDAKPLDHSIVFNEDLAVLFLIWREQLIMEWQFLTDRPWPHHVEPYENARHRGEP